MSTLILTVHGLWLIWMVSGVVMAVVSIWYPQFRRMLISRTLHLVGILATATVPIWNDGVCPLTSWESGTDSPKDSFVGRICMALLYWDASQLMLSAVSAAAALLTLVLYFWYPPWTAIPEQDSNRDDNI